MTTLQVRVTEDHGSWFRCADRARVFSFDLPRASCTCRNVGGTRLVDKTIGTGALYICAGECSGILDRRSFVCPVLSELATQQACGVPRHSETCSRSIYANASLYPTGLLPVAWDLNQNLLASGEKQQRGD